MWESVEALNGAKSKTNEQLAADIDLAIVNCADKLVQADEREKAKEIFATLYKEGGPSRLAALRGLVMADPNQCADLLVEAIRGQDLRLAMLAISLTPQATGNNVTGKFVAILPDLPAEAKIPMLKGARRAGGSKCRCCRDRRDEKRKRGIPPGRRRSTRWILRGPSNRYFDRGHHQRGRASPTSCRASLAHIESADSRLEMIAQNSDEKLTLGAMT